MATFAGLWERLSAARGYDQVAAHVRVQQPDDQFRIRAIANEDLYFFAKRIDNSRVVRQADPHERSMCWRLIGASVSAAVMLVALLVPALFGMVEGYRIESLRQEKQRLLSERAVLELSEAKLMSPERLERLAIKQSFIDPDPQEIVFLPAKSESHLAQGIAPVASDEAHATQQ